MATDPTPAPPPSAPPPAPEPPPDLKILWLRLALFLATIGVLGSLHLSLGMNLKACPLCFYQRAFIMSAAAVLALGMFVPGISHAGLTVLALAPAFAGFSIAAFHSYLDWTEVLECPKGVTGFLTAPQESFLVFLLLIGALLGDLFHRRRLVMQGVGAILLGIVFCTTSIRAVPESPAPTQPYANEVPDICRKPFPPKT